MKNVLVVGNCESDYIELKGFLEINFEVKTKNARSIHEAKGVLEKDKDYALILVPRSGYFDHKPGVLLIEYLQDNAVEIPVFVLTGDETSAKEAIKKGARGAFSKDDIYADEEKAKVISLLKEVLTVKE